MAQILSICLSNPSKTLVISSSLPKLNDGLIPFACRSERIHRGWDSLRRNLKVSCLFSDNRNKEQARKALESALGGKRTEFEKWDKEIKRREEAGGGGGGGGGGWFRWFGGSDGEHFWQEAQQVSLTLLAIAVTYMIITKGDVLLAFVFNPLLAALRAPRDGLSYVSSQVLRKVSPSAAATYENIPKEEVYARNSAKESVMRKWGSD